MNPTDHPHLALEPSWHRSLTAIAAVFAETRKCEAVALARAPLCAMGANGSRPGKSEIRVANGESATPLCGLHHLHLHRRCLD
jgi:hypothetical protein